MLCVECEVIRARIIAAGLLIVGKSLDDIAAHLTVRYGVVYFVDKGELWRSNNPSSILIWTDDGI